MERRRSAELRSYEEETRAHSAAECSVAKPGEPLYLHLSDVGLAFEAVGSKSPVHILHYRDSELPSSRVSSAKNSGAGEVVKTWSGPSTEGRSLSQDEKDGSFKLILSNQVLSHVQAYRRYLAEAYRLLEDGGEFICTASSEYIGVGVSPRYWSWTAYSLTKVCEEAGFVVTQVLNLTTGPRALLFLIEQGQMQLSSLTKAGITPYVSNLVDTTNHDTAEFHRWCDATYHQFRVSSFDPRQKSFSLGLLIKAQKPPRKQWKEFKFMPFS